MEIGQKKFQIMNTFNIIILIFKKIFMGMFYFLGKCFSRGCNLTYLLRLDCAVKK